MLFWQAWNASLIIHNLHRYSSSPAIKNNAIRYLLLILILFPPSKSHTSLTHPVPSSYPRSEVGTSLYLSIIYSKVRSRLRWTGITGLAHMQGYRRKLRGPLETRGKISILRDFVKFNLFVVSFHSMLSSGP